MTTESEIISKLLRMRSDIAAATLQSRLRLLAEAVKYDPSQPRVPAGNPDGGQWTDSGGGAADDLLPGEEGSNESGEVSVESILALAPRLAAAGASLNRCIALCSPLLERYQLPGTTNINYWDFVRCLNACLGK